MCQSEAVIAKKRRLKGRNGTLNLYWLPIGVTGVCNKLDDRERLKYVNLTCLPTGFSYSNLTHLVLRIYAPTFMQLVNVGAHLFE
jgi:hypothetical protein